MFNFRDAESTWKCGLSVLLRGGWVSFGGARDRMRKPSLTSNRRFGCPTPHHVMPKMPDLKVKHVI